MIYLYANMFLAIFLLLDLSYDVKLKEISMHFDTFKYI